MARDRDNTLFVAAAAGGGALVAVGLVGVMAFKIGAFCKWCLLVDGSTFIAALAAAWVHLEALRDPAYLGFLAAPREAPGAGRRLDRRRPPSSSGSPPLGRHEFLEVPPLHAADPPPCRSLAS